MVPLRKAFVLVASIAIVLTLVKVAGFREVAAVWRSIELLRIALSAACYYAALAVRILSWRRLLGRDSPGFCALTPSLALGFILGYVSPAKSGEPAAAVLVSRAFDMPLARPLSALTAERAVQLATLLATFLPAAMIYAGEILELGATVRAAAILAAIILFGFVLAQPALRRLESVASRLPRLGSAVSEYARTLAEILASREKMPPLFGLATLYWLLQYLSLWAILDGGGASVNLIAAAVVSGAAIVGGTLTMLPLGTQDGISAVVLRGMGVPLAQGFSLALFHTVLSLTCGAALLAALPLLLRRRRDTVSGS